MMNHTHILLGHRDQLGSGLMTTYDMRTGEEKYTCQLHSGNTKMAFFFDDTVNFKSTVTYTAPSTSTSTSSTDIFISFSYDQVLRVWKWKDSSSSGETLLCPPQCLLSIPFECEEETWKLVHRVGPNQLYFFANYFTPQHQLLVLGRDG
jgi:hypothetical protein